MRLDFENANLELDRMQSLALRDSAGLQVRCLQGTVWITQEGSDADQILKPGESFTLKRDGLTVICALGGAARFTARAATPGVAPVHAARSRGALARLTSMLSRAVAGVALRSHPAGRLHGC